MATWHHTLSSFQRWMKVIIICTLFSSHYLLSFWRSHPLLFFIRVRLDWVRKNERRRDTRVFTRVQVSRTLARYEGLVITRSRGFVEDRTVAHSIIIENSRCFIGLFISGRKKYDRSTWKNRGKVHVCIMWVPPSWSFCCSFFSSLLRGGPPDSSLRCHAS